VHGLTPTARALVVCSASSRAYTPGFMLPSAPRTGCVIRQAKLIDGSYKIKRAQTRCALPLIHLSSASARLAAEDQPIPV
jgi:hypothetical protein